jgi:haloalkane dehalogenase
MAQPPESNVSSEFPFTLQSVEILGSKMAYVDSSSPNNSASGTANFLHGNPTSSYIWRNIIPHVSPKLRCVAPDLIGMGHSSKPDIAYRFADHARYIEAFLDVVVPTGKVIFVIQDWGSALGFDWAYRHKGRVAGFAFMELVRPFPTWDEAAKGKAETFNAFRDPALGRKLIIEQNAFINVMLPRGSVRTLTSIEKEYYAAPYQDEKSREPLFRWPNEIPIEGHPADVYERVEQYHDWLLQNDIPKLFFWATPGRIVSEEKAKWYLETLKNVKGVFVGRGVHFLQEDHPHQIGEEIFGWIDSVQF